MWIQCEVIHLITTESSTLGEYCEELHSDSDGERIGCMNYKNHQSNKRPNNKSQNPVGNKFASATIMFVFCGHQESV